MLLLAKASPSASTKPAHCLEEVSCIQQLLQFGFPVQAAAPLAKHPDVQKVLVERTHFSARRRLQFELTLHGYSGWTQPLIAEWLGEDTVAYAQRETHRLRKSRRQQLFAEEEGFLACPDLGLVLRRPGLDAKLPGLRMLRYPHLAAELLQRLEGRPPGPVNVSLIAHRLGKRAVLRVESAGAGIRYIRLRATSSLSGQRCFDLHKALYDCLAGQEEMAIPAAVGFDADLGAAVFRQLPGEPACWRGESGVDAGEAISRAISRLQSVQGPPLPHHTAKQENLILGNLYRRVQIVFPALAEQLAEPMKQTASSLHTLRELPPVMTHRDLHQGQILFVAGKPGLLDFDTVCLADPVVDVSNLQAHLYLSSLRDQSDSSAMEHELLRFLPAFSPTRLSSWRAAALLRLAMIYAFTHESAEVIQQLIREAAVCCSE